MARSTKSESTAGLRPVLDGSAGIYLFYGDELFLRRLMLNRLISRVLGLKDEAGVAHSGDAAMAVSQFDGDDASLATVLDELRTLPFLAQRRVVIVQDADGFVSAHREALEKYLANPCPTGVLVLLAAAERSNSNLFKKVAARGGAVACDKLAHSDLARWIRERASQPYGKVIDYETASLLADLIGDDLDRLDSELGKLATYLGEERKTITTEDVDELVANQRLHDAFELARAIGNKDAPGALLRWNDMVAKDSDAPYRSVGLIAWQVRQFLRARALRSQGLSRDQVFSKLRVPFSVRDKFVEQVSRFSERRLRTLLADLVKLDLGAKTGGTPPERGIELFIVSACASDAKG